MTINLQELLTPKVAAQWESNLTETGFPIRFDRVITCPDCGPEHQRVFFETDWDEDEADHPARAVVITVSQNRRTFVMVDHFESGIRQLRFAFHVADIRSFLASGAGTVSMALRSMRLVSSQEVPHGLPNVIVH